MVAVAMEAPHVPRRGQVLVALTSATVAAAAAEAPEQAAAMVPVSGGVGSMAHLTSSAGISSGHQRWAVGCTPNALQSQGCFTGNILLLLMVTSKKKRTTSAQER